MGLDGRLRKLEQRLGGRRPRLWVLVVAAAAECGRPPGAYRLGGGWALVTESGDVPDVLPPPLDEMFDPAGTKVVSGVDPWKM